MESSPSNEPVAGQWDFDRQRADDASGLEYTTFSVGIFQWLPARRGLKKSRTIRVVGYVTEPERVFEKAEELCRRLNAEKVDSANPPAWVQKQYSVPRPDDLVVERVRDDLTGSQVRSIRQAVMKRVLLPHGFVKGNGSVYVRRQNDQIHFIEFQAARWGHSYGVNIGFHYAFLPGFFRHKMIEPPSYHVLDCGLRGFPGGSFQYGSDKEALATTLGANAVYCLNLFGELAEKWADPSVWVTQRTEDLIPPPVQAHWIMDHPELWRGCLAAHLGLTDRALAEFNAFVASAQDEGWEIAFRRSIAECCQALGFDPGMAAS